MVVYIYYIKAAGNSLSSQLGSSCHGNNAVYNMEKAGGSARPSRTKSQLPGPSASQVGRRVWPALYILCPHWWDTRGMCTCKVILAHNHSRLARQSECLASSHNTVALHVKENIYITELTSCTMCPWLQIPVEK
jgi:hypothetical protein